MQRSWHVVITCCRCETIHYSNQLLQHQKYVACHRFCAPLFISSTVIKFVYGIGVYYHTGNIEIAAQGGGGWQWDHPVAVNQWLDISRLDYRQAQAIERRSRSAHTRSVLTMHDTRADSGRDRYTTARDRLINIFGFVICARESHYFTDSIADGVIGLYAPHSILLSHGYGGQTWYLAVKNQ